MTPLQQFNEEAKKQYDELFDDPSSGGDLRHYTKKFITQKLTEHKALILKMVREKVPIRFEDDDAQTNYGEGWNNCCEEFLNNLDTI